MRDHSTHTEHDAGISAAWDAYPEPPEMSRADLAQEGDWWHEYMREGRHREVEPGLLVEALGRAVAQVACQGCGKYGAPSVCSHGKNICEDCWPDLCWACQGDAAGEGDR